MSEVKYGVFAIAVLAAALAALHLVDEGLVVLGTVIALLILIFDWCRRSTVA